MKVDIVYKKQDWTTKNLQVEERADKYQKNKSTSNDEKQ